MPFNLDVKHAAGDAVVCRLEGSLDAAAAPDFEAAFLPLAEDPKLLRIILECADLDYVASAGLRVFLKAVRAIDGRNAHIFGVGLHGSVQSVLRMTGFFKYIQERPSVEECTTS